MTLPGTCAECGHAVAVHSSAGCLWSVVGLGCKCAHTREEAGCA